MNLGSWHGLRRSKIARLALGAALLTAAFASGCSGGAIASHAAVASPAPSASSADAPAAVAAPAALNVACSPVAKLPAQTMNPSGGALTIPACGSFSGVLAYPSFGGVSGNITATLTSSLRNNIGSGASISNTNAIFYIALRLASSNPSDSSVTFASFVDEKPSDCGEINGSFTSGTTYYAIGAFPFSAGVNSQISHNDAGSGTFQGAGCSFKGESLALGKQNDLLVSTSPN